MASAPQTDVPCGIFSFDDDRRIVAINDVATGLLGHEASALIGQPIATILPVATRMFFQTHVFPVLALGQRADELYLRFRTASGGDLPVLLNVARSTGGERPLSHCAFLSVQRRHLFERELIAAKHEAERAAAREREAMTELRTVQAQLALRERLASVGTLAAGVAHEVNNPLAYVAGNLELMSDLLEPLPPDPAASAELVTLLRDAREGVDRIRAIVDSLRTLSRVDETRRVPVELGRVVEIAVRMAGNELRHRARVTVVSPPPSPVVWADEGRLGQVVLNLVVNAAQALPEGRSSDNRIVITVRTDGDQTGSIEVADNGPGIPVEIQNRIFDPFFTTKPVGKGTGLGLAMAHGIVTSLGGTLTLESAPGEGARFRMTLPLHQAAPRPAPRDLAPGPPSSPLAPSPATASLLPASPLASSPATASLLPASPLASSPLASSPLAPSSMASSPLASSPLASSPLASSPLAPSPLAPSGLPSSPPPSAAQPPVAQPPVAQPPSLAAPSAPARRRVLIVDDDERVSRLLARAVREHEVVVCNNGREAVTRCEGGESFDLILCDLMMPEMTGIEVHAALLAMDPAVASRMIFLTGGAFTDSAQRFLERVPNPRLEKPFSIPVLLQLCNAVLAGAPTPS